MPHDTSAHHMAIERGVEFERLLRGIGRARDHATVQRIVNNLGRAIERREKQEGKMGASGCEFDVTDTVRNSTDKMLDNCDRAERTAQDRMENLLNVLDQCRDKTNPRPAFALDYIQSHANERLISPAQAEQLAAPFIIQVERWFNEIGQTARLMKVATISQN